VDLGVKKVIVNLLRQKLNKNQKASLKYLLLVLGIRHLKTIFFRKDKFGSSVPELFLNLRPIKTEYELLRKGGITDGSYLIPDLPIDYQGVVSPGVGQTFEFERDIVDEGTKVVLVDGTIEKPRNLPTDFIFRQEMLTDQTNVSSGEVTLSDLILQEFPNSNSLVLSMDIEGSEYRVLSSSSIGTLSRFSLLVIEFHQLQKVLVDKSNNAELTNVFNKLKSEFRLLHTHPNNAGGFFLYRFRKIPKVIETTWIHKSLVKHDFGFAKIPNRLDYSNESLIADLKFPFL